MKKIATIFLFLIFSQISFSQVTGGSAIMPGELAWKVGLGGGFAYGFSTGTLSGDCGYEFEGLKGPGFYISASGSMPIDFVSDLYASISYQSLSLKASTEKLKEKDWVNENDEPQPDKIKANHESKAVVDLSSINLDIYYKRKLVKEFFVVCGLGLHVISTNNFNQDEAIKDDNYVFSGSEKTNRTLYDGEIKDLISLQISGRIGMGYDFKVGEKYLLTPVVVFDYPFTKLTTSNTLKILSFNLGLQLSYVF